LKDLKILFRWRVQRWIEFAVNPRGVPMYYADEVVLDKVLARTIVRDLAKIAPNPYKFPAE